MRLPLVVGNWKMNTTIDEAKVLARSMLAGLSEIKGVEKVLCPPFISLAAVREIIQGSSIKLGAQNAYSKDKGAYTGEISPLMLSQLCEFVILGHSERRQYFAETDDIVNEKIKASLGTGLIPILCVGEKLEENEAGKTTEIITKQLKAALNAVKPSDKLVIAYEPIWAIGTGRAASAIQAATIIKLIRHTIAELWGNESAQNMRILYGGSISSANIDEFIAETEIDGALVGGASLEAKEFLSIISQVAAIKKSQLNSPS